MEPQPPSKAMLSSASRLRTEQKAPWLPVAREVFAKLTLIGSEGFLEVGLWSPHVGLRSAKGKAFPNFYRLDAAVPRRPPLDGSFVDQLRNLVAAAKGELEVLVNGYEGWLRSKSFEELTPDNAEPSMRNIRS